MPDDRLDDAMGDTELAGGDRVFRSHFQHANRPVDRAADAREVEKIEKDHENGWLNVRVGSGEWAAVPEQPILNHDRSRQGRVSDMPPAGTSPSHDRVTFSDPVAGGVDPTSPEGPENRP